MLRATCLVRSYAAHLLHKSRRERRSYSACAHRLASREHPPASPALPELLAVTGRLALAAAASAVLLLTYPTAAHADEATLAAQSSAVTALAAEALDDALVSAPPTAAALSAFREDQPIVDEARLVPRGQLEELQRELRSLEKDTGWRVRLLSRVGARRPTDEQLEEIRSGWRVDARTVVILADPTSPNLFSLKWGSQVSTIMPNRFFSELQSRFGNLYYVREQGEGQAVIGLLDALSGCLRSGGCKAVPGVTPEQYQLTLQTTIAGGLVFGATSRIEPQGWVQRRWVWPLLFSPLWGSLFISFGLGPIFARTDDPQLILQNCLAFAVTAAVVVLAPGLSNWTGMRPWGDDDNRS